MTTRPAAPRIRPLPAADQDEATRELLDGVDSSLRQTNIVTTLVRHPGLIRRWVPFAGRLLSGRLPARVRELAILRTGWLCAAEYEWGQHVLIGRQAGLTDEEISRVRQGPDAAGWTELESAVLRAADELHADACISEGTWQALAAQLDEPQLIELPMLVGQYHLVAFTLNSLGVEREPGVPGFDG
jgi:4-carboxymuconolactone decarboxylase